MTATARLAEFVVKTTLRECPDGAITQVRRAALDTLGVMLAGAAEPAAASVRAVVRAEGSTPLCTVVGTSLRTAPTWAALANGTAGHAHDFDDTNFALMGHPSAPLLAAALAAGEAEMADGGAVVLAYLIGFEVSAALGLAFNPDHYTRGWHATSTIGTLGCAAAAAKLLGLDAGQTRHALGVAASLASGLKENFGSMAKPFHAGHAARNGVFAAMLAREGFTASDDGATDAGTRALMGRVRMVVDPSLPDGLEQHAWSRVTVRLHDGRTLDSPARGASGHPDQPLTDAQLRAKFLGCAAPVLGADEAEGVAEQLAHLEEVPDIRALTSRLATTRE